MILAEDDAMFDLIRLNGGINQHPFAWAIRKFGKWSIFGNTSDEILCDDMKKKKAREIRE
jgi:hypothetical protein